MTKNQIARERIQKMQQWMREDSAMFLQTQMICAHAVSQSSPADELLDWFAAGIEGRDVGAEVLLQLALTCTAMLALDLMQEESARMN